MENFEKYVNKGNLIIGEVAEELGMPERRDIAGRVLRAVLHTLRQAIPPEESFKLLAQLPLVIKGLYIEGWNPYKPVEKVTTVSQFVSHVIREDFPAGHHDFGTAKDGENATRAVFKVLQQHLSSGEVIDVKELLSEELQGFWTFETR